MEFNAADIFEGVVDRIPDREAVVLGSTRLTYKELDARTNKAANALKKLGIKKGSHIGIYAFRINTLKDICKLPQSKNEIRERLEQLRWLDNGYKIKVGITAFEALAVDTAEDIEKIEQKMG